MTTIYATNPRTGLSDYSFEAASPEDIAGLASIARKAQRRWHDAGVSYRSEVMLRWAHELESRKEQIAAALEIDTGRKKISSEEVDAIFHMIHGHVEQAAKVFAPPSENGDAPVDFRQQYVPYGLVGVIGPWNFPMVLCLIDALPALFAGNAVLCKPSEVTPRFVEPLRESVAAVPELDGIVNFVLGGPEAGKSVVDNVDLVVFTGSIPTGRRIAEAAARRFIPCFLELGGKDAAIVTAGADLNRAATCIIRSALYNTGQVCYAIERVYAQKQIYDDLMNLLVEKSKTLDLSFPDPHKGEIGPFILQRQADIVLDHLKDAEGKGASILTGGKIETHGGGRWMRATVVGNVNHDMRLMTEETFGPVIAVMAFDSIEDAIALANDGDFGLSGAVFAATVDEGTAIAERLDAGGISVNDTELTRAITFVAEKNAFRFSGSGGSRYGAAMALRFVRKKAIIRNRGSVKPLTALSEDVS